MAVAVGTVVTVAIGTTTIAVAMADAMVGVDGAAMMVAAVTVNMS
jgi:hypothetical protein